MCGIAGIIGVADQEIKIESILTRIKHRGPDGLFYWEQDHIALAHARLSIIDLSIKANQPMVDDDTGNVIIFNGEIYNYVELKKKIGKAYHFKTNSDTEVILAAYKIYGIQFIEQLQGMFAFALYDKERNKLLLARDRVGIKPLYYRSINGTFIFASEIKAILNPSNKPEAVNEIKAYEFLANRQLDTNSETLFEGIMQLPAAHYVWVEANGRIGDIIPYWTYPALGNRLFDTSAQKEFVELFNHTIQLHLRSDVEVGAFLSGGIDSSSVTCFALSNMQQQQLHTFSGILPYYHPENALIDDVLSLSDQLVPHQFMLDGTSFFEDIRDVIYHHDEPILDGSMFAHYKLCELAKQQGIKVLLSGSGGDELFGGYGSYINAHHASLLAAGKLPQYIEAIKKIASTSTHTYTSLLMRSVYENVPANIRTGLKNRQLRNRNKHLEIQPYIEHYQYKDKDNYYANLLNNYRSWTVPPYLHYEDRNSMAFGVEIRVPFYDHKLMEFVFQFAPDQIINGSSKSILRNSFKGIVPEKVLAQKGKYGFPSPIDHALITNKKGKEYFFDLLDQTPLLKKKETAQVGLDFYNGKDNLTTYWRLLSYMLWYDIFFKQKALQ